MDMNPAKEIYIVRQGPLNFGSNLIPFRHSYGAIYTNGDIDHQIRTKPVGLDLVYVFHLIYSAEYPRYLLIERPPRYCVH